MARNKTVRVDLRISPEEKESLQAKSKQARMKMSEYILALSEQKKIFVIDGIPELTIEITRIGVNVNQIAMVVNAHKTASDFQLKQVNDSLEEIQNILTTIIKAIYGADDEDMEI